MAREIINIGTTANDRQGDSLRDGGGKINRNFAELYEVLGGDSSSISSVVTLSSTGVLFNGLNFDTTFQATEGTSDLLISLPDSAGTVVINSARQTLTNKTLSRPIIDSASFNNFLVNDADNSHKYLFQPSNLTSDRTINIPTITSDDTLVLRTTTQTLTNKTLASPRVTTGIFDANGAELIRATAVASAVNDINVSNAATGNSPSIAVTGDDTNINLRLDPKGTGVVSLGKVAYTVKQVGVGDSDTTASTIILANPSASLSLSLDNGTADGEQKILINRGSGSFVVNQTGTNFALPGGATSIAIGTNGSAQLVWIGGAIAKWFMIGSADSADTLISLS